MGLFNTASAGTPAPPPAPRTPTRAAPPPPPPRAASSLDKSRWTEIGWNKIGADHLERPLLVIYPDEYAKGRVRQGRVAVRGVSLIAVAITGTALLAGCGDDRSGDTSTRQETTSAATSAPSTSGPETLSVPSTEPTPTETEEAEPDGISGSFSMTNSDGYTVDVSYRLNPSAWVADPTNSPPGVTEISLPLTSEITLTNTTEARATPTPWFSVIALYPAASSLCHLEAVPFLTTRHCFLEVRDAATLPEGNPAQPAPTLEPGASETFVLDGSERFTDPHVVSVPEEVVETTDLDTPEAWLLVPGGLSEEDWSIDEGGCTALWYSNRANTEPGEFGDRGEPYGPIYNSDPAICASLR